MKNFLLFCAMVFAVSLPVYAQQTPYFLLEKDGKFSINTKGADNTFAALSDDQLKAIKLEGGLNFDRTNLVTSTGLKIESQKEDKSLTNITTTGFNIDGAKITFKGGDFAKDIISLVLTFTPASGISKNISIGSVVPKIDTKVDPAKDVTTYASWREFYKNDNSNNDLNIIRSRSRYLSNLNTAYICLDPYGNIIGRKPVNLDQDDNVIILMIVPDNSVYDNYSVNDNDAQYAPSDLNIRPADNINTTHSEKSETPIKYTVKKFEKGPYTSSDVTFTIMNGNQTLNQLTVHINPLYHLGLGVSYVSSSLESPEYQVIPLTSTTNTIKAVNTGRRTFLTINAIWYWWSTFKYLNGSSITRGRDVLKEPSLLTRINPTFGVGLKGNLENNFFGGLSFEFARGGSISAGWHYGKVTGLLDDKFQLGVTEFTGQQADIKTTDTWKWGGFFGVTLDTRIFNRLFSSTKSSDN